MPTRQARNVQTLNELATTVSRFSWHESQIVLPSGWVLGTGSGPAKRRGRRRLAPLPADRQVAGGRIGGFTSANPSAPVVEIAGHDRPPILIRPDRFGKIGFEPDRRVTLPLSRLPCRDTPLPPQSDGVADDAPWRSLGSTRENHPRPIVRLVAVQPKKREPLATRKCARQTTAQPLTR